MKKIFLVLGRFLYIFTIFLIGFITGVYKEKIEQQSVENQETKYCSIEKNFGPNGEFVLIENITIKKQCASEDQIDTYCILGMYKTIEEVRLAATEQRCIIDE